MLVPDSSIGVVSFRGGSPPICDGGCGPSALQAHSKGSQTVVSQTELGM